MNARSMIVAGSVLSCLAGCVPLTGPDHGDVFDVLAVEPKGGAVASDQRFSVLFSRPLRAESVGECAVALAPDDESGEKIVEAYGGKTLPASVRTEVVCGELTLESGPARVSFKPGRALKPGSTYRLLVAGAVKDADGFSLRDARGGAFVAGEAYRVQGGLVGGGLVISEVMANPRGPETQGEYVELYNPGDKPIDVQFWRLVFKDGPAQELGACGRDTAVPPGGYALIGADDFVPLPESRRTPVACVQGRLGSKGLVNYAGQVFSLENPRGETVSSYTGWLASTDEGFSIERVRLDGADEAGNWAVSMTQGGTPGAANSAKPAAVRAKPPALVRFDPSGASVRPSARFDLRFDQPVRCPNGGCIGIFASAESCRSGGAPVVKVEAGYLGDTVTVAPAGPLGAARRYHIGVRGLDGAGGRQTGFFCVPFGTGAEPDRTKPGARLSYPADGAGDVPIDLMFVEIEFSEPVTVAPAAIHLSRGAGSRPAGCHEEKSGVVFRCQPDGALEPGVHYTVEIAGAAVDAAGNLASRGIIGGFWTGVGPDESAPEFFWEVVSPAPRGVELRWQASEPCVMAYSIYDGPSGDEILSGVAETTSASGDLFLLLDLANRRYEAAGYCTDLSGNASGTVVLPLGATVLGPAVALTELMINPAGKDDGREWVELHNYGGEPVELSGWGIGRCADRKPSVISGGTPAILSPGESLLLAGTELEKGDGLPWGARVIAIEGGPISGGMSNSTGERICLTGPAGELVSIYGGWLVPPEGYTVQRVDPYLPDMAGNWKVSAAEGGNPSSFAVE